MTNRKTFINDHSGTTSGFIFPSLSRTQLCASVLLIMFILSSCSNGSDSCSNPLHEKEIDGEESILKNELGYIIDMRPSVDQSAKYKRQINSQHGGFSTEEWITFDSLHRPNSFHFLSVIPSIDFKSSRNIELQVCSTLNFDGAILTLSSGSKLLYCEEANVNETFKLKVDEFDLNEDQLNIEYTRITKNLSDSSVSSYAIHKSYIVENGNILECVYEDKTQFREEKIKIMETFYNKWWK
ncbi:MAG: hypothetical protein ACJA1C_000081 [Crocinitomicaceae bacterium]|jgi:hypothetical protein